MSVSKLTKKDYVSDVSDRFIHLPDKLIIIILKKLKDTKALIRCSLVCKHLHCLVSKVDTVFLRFSYPGEAGEYLPCWKFHCHVPQSAIPSLMKVFANVKFLVINLCLCPSLLPCLYGEKPSRQAYKLLLKSVDVNDKMHTHLCTAFELGLLISDDERRLSFEPNLLIGEVNGSLLLSFFIAILCHRPKTLSSVVILSSGMMAHGLEAKVEYRSEGKVGYRSEGNLFMEAEHLASFHALRLQKKLNEDWLNDPENMVCWLKKQEEIEHRFGERLWIIHKWEGERCNMDESTATESDVEQLLSAFDGDNGEINENADLF